MSAVQLSLFGPADEAETYHDVSGRGFFSLLVQHSDGMRQSSYPLSDMAAVLKAADSSHDTWLSQAEFMRPNRRVVNLLRIGLLFADIDTYKKPWSEGKTPEALAEGVLEFCLQEGLPPPSLIVFSGRGVQAKWLLERALPRQALPRWNACQKRLVERLNALGADPGARDAGRVLRLVNTVNTKSGAVCRVLHVSEEKGETVRYNFEYLAGILLPTDRRDMERSRKDDAERHGLRAIPGGYRGNLKIFSGRRLAWDRLEDLRKLAVIRGGVEEGERMRHLFWRLNFLLLSGATNSNLMYHEAAALAREVNPRWSYRSQELMTLYAKAKQYEAGGKVTFGGLEFPPLYTPKNETLISLFEITDEEQRQLSTIISHSQALERDKTRKSTQRREAGAIERSAYEEHSLAHQKPWETLGISRATWYRRGKPSPETRETGASVLLMA